MVSIKDDISRTNEYLWKTNETTLYYILQSYLDIKVNILKKKKNRGATLATLIVCCSIASCIVALSCSLMLPTEVGLAQYQALISIIGGKLFCYWWSVLQIKSLVICIEYKITSSNKEWFHAEITCQIHQCNKALHLPEQGLQLPTSTPLFPSKTLISPSRFQNNA